MWHNNKKITRTFASKDSQNGWAIVSTVSGWKKIKTGATDGVTNLFAMLTTANAADRAVDVYIVDDKIERVVMR